MLARHSKQWSEHIHSERWYCDVDHNELSIGPSEFDEKVEFMNHLNTFHGDKLTQSRILGRLRRNRRIATRDPFVCPLCDCVPSDVAERLSDKPYELLWKHIAAHLKSVAFLSLSYIEVDQEEDRESMSPSLKSNDDDDTKVSRHSLSESSNILYCGRDSCDCTDEKNSPVDWTDIPESQLPTSQVDPKYDAPNAQLEWEFCYPFSLPPDCKRVGPLEYQGHANDARLLRYFEKLQLDNMIDDRLVKVVEPFGEGCSEFVPEDQIMDLLSKENVSTTLRQFDVPLGKELLNFILYRAKRLFLTLVRIRQVNAIPQLKAEGFCDDHLPLGVEKCYDNSSPNHWIVGPLDETTGELRQKGWPRTFESWDYSNVDRFFIYQWCFLTPIFGEAGSFFQRFDKSRQLPFTKVSRGPGQASGQAGEVYQVTIHKSHTTFEPAMVALKSFKRREYLNKEKDYFNKELEMLREIKKLKHDHLINPLAAFENTRLQCALFPWCDGGTYCRMWD